MLAPAKRARYCRTFSVTPLRPKCRSLGDDRSRAGRARRSLSSCPSVAAGIGSRILTWSHVPRKFTRLSHLSVGVTRNPVFSSFRSGAPVGSIPIARSTLRLASGHVGTRDWDQDIDPVGKSWEYASIWGLPHILRYPYVAPAFTRTVTRSSSQK